MLASVQLFFSQLMIKQYKKIKGGMDTERTAAKQNSSMEITQSLASTVDDPVIPPDVLDSATTPQFQSLPTSWLAILLTCIHASAFGLSVALAVFCSIKESQFNCQKYIQTPTIIVIAKLALWLLTTVFERYVQHHHNWTRNKGYLQFYRSTRNLKCLPFFIHSAGNAVFLLILSSKSMEHLYVYLMLGVLMLELCFSIPFLLFYVVKVMHFNTKKLAADINQEGLSKIDFRNSSSVEVMEKQADLIEYLKQQNRLLSEQLLSLTSKQVRD
ncbi:transmembrane protein 192-like [Polyodon spathula]|uniref:transmembrane protein 192-like n=1 Tax=Polyodon spathula TaxID=7913 RepID=UPI001B7EB3CC|nr:transmembrane protein 192-like [Polyodon spathula]